MFKSLLSVFGSKAVDIKKRFEVKGKWVNSLTGPVRIAIDRSSNQTYGLKIVDQEKANKIRERYQAKGIVYPSELELTKLIYASVADKHGLLDVVEFGVTTKNEPFMLTEYFESSLLSNVIADQSQRPKNRILLIQQLANTILGIHDAGFFHRDINPFNIICDQHRRFVKLFNYCSSTPATDDFKKPIGRSGAPIYMAPEILRRRGVSERSDIFSFGVTVFQLMTRVHPWGVTENSAKAALVFDTTPPRDIRELIPKIPDSFADAVMKCLQVIPDKRHKSMKHFLIASRLK
ncbi:MAG: protein kinase [Planctomycetota bacterium]